jgi:protocatechuate 3,4-dioxygenase beta subunit
MNRKSFLKKVALGIGAVSAIPAVVAISKKNHPRKNPVADAGCELSPDETAGPFPNKHPNSLVKSDIVDGRAGVGLSITLTVLKQAKECLPLPGVFVDVWHCDAKGEYSQYGSNRMQKADHTKDNYLRGRQTTDKDGKVNFVSIYPGWYPGRAPHIHVEVLDQAGESLGITQIAFPEEVNNAVYAASSYRGKSDMANDEDMIFRDSLHQNMTDTMDGDIENGYNLTKTIIV